MRKTYKNEIQNLLNKLKVESEVLKAIRKWSYLIYTVKCLNTGVIIEHKINAGYKPNFESIINQVKLHYSQTDIIDFLKED